MRLALPAALGLWLALGCGARIAAPTTDKQPPFTFPHATHVDSDVACTNCHAAVEKATALSAGVRHVELPATPSKVKACSDCHDTDPSISVPARTAPPRFTFSHADHLPRVGGDCKRCHRQLTEKGELEPRRPPMAACTECHGHQTDFAEARCRPCHVDLKGYRPETAFRHGADWMRGHGALAKPSAETCAQCHDQTYCAGCHSPTTAAAGPSIVFPERVDRPFIHRGDYVSRHMIEQAANPASCQRCHGSAFCSACHVQQNLTKAAGSSRRPQSHEALDWATPATPGAQPEHGRAGRRDISACAACHDQGASATCVLCHRVGGVADLDRNGPHPPSFISKHRGDDRTRNAVCRACHPS